MKAGAVSIQKQDTGCRKFLWGTPAGQETGFHQPSNEVRDRQTETVVLVLRVFVVPFPH